MRMSILPVTIVAMTVMSLHGSAEAQDEIADAPLPVAIHSAVLTVVHLPDAVERVRVLRVLDDEHVIIWGNERAVYVRPREDAPPGHEVEIQVITETLHKHITLRVVERADEAVQHVSLAPLPTMAPIELPQEHAMTAPARPAPERPHRARQPAQRAARSTSPRLGLSVHGTVGLARVGDGATAGQEETYLTGAAARASYALHDRLACEIELAMARSGSARFADVDWRGEMGDMKRITELGRALMGVRLRLAAAVYAPTVHLAVGGQTRPATPSVLILGDGSAVEGPPTSRSWDVTVAGGLGFEVPIAARWLAGAAVSAVQALPLGGAQFQSIEGSAYVAHHWHW
jgi:hypothetical protein